MNTSRHRGADSPLRCGRETESLLELGQIPADLVWGVAAVDPLVEAVDTDPAHAAELARVTRYWHVFAASQHVPESHIDVLTRRAGQALCDQQRLITEGGVESATTASSSRASRSTAVAGGSVSTCPPEIPRRRP